MENFEISPIGVIHTPFAVAADAPIQGRLAAQNEGEVEVFEAYVPALAGVEGFSHLTLLYYFHQAGPTELVVKPFLDDARYGVFATRHPRRPNHLGLTTVRLIERRENVLVVSGVDMLDGTPLVDIKPYVPAFDRAPEDVRYGWLEGKIGPA
jgi:tRNA-Thr(GGU) m(6)t(6)A37 methyltransferase TsaA